MTVPTKGHLSTERLRAALRDGFRDDRERWRAIYHLGPGRCPVCCRRLRELSRSTKLIWPFEDPPDMQFDSLVMTLRRLVVTLSAQAANGKAGNDR